MKIEEIILQISARIRAIRKEQKLTQREFADIFGISQSSYSAYENGSTIPTVEFLIKVAQKYNISMDYLTGLSISKKGMQADDDNKLLQKTIVDPIIETGGNEKELLQAYIRQIRDEQSKANEASETAVAQIMKIIQEKYPEE